MAKHFHDIGRLKSRLEARQAGTPFSAADPLDRQVSESVFQTCVAFCSRVARVTVLLVHPLLTQSHSYPLTHLLTTPPDAARDDVTRRRPEWPSAPLGSVERVGG